MRTVSFSDDSVRKLLNGEFVCAYTNIEGDPSAGASIRHRPDDPPGPCIRGNGRQNVQTIFLTPGGEVLHAATGYLEPGDLAAEARFARELFESLPTEPGAQRDHVSARHMRRLSEAGFSDDQIHSPGMSLAMPIPDFSSMLRPGRVQGNATPPTAVDPSHVFQAMIRQQFLEDNRFSVRHPLMDWKALQRDATPLVGNGTSFFASSSGSR